MVAGVWDTVLGRALGRRDVAQAGWMAASGEGGLLAQQEACSPEALQAGREVSSGLVPATATGAASLGRGSGQGSGPGGEGAVGGGSPKAAAVGVSGEAVGAVGHGRAQRQP